MVITGVIEAEAAPTLANRSATARRNASIEPVGGTQAKTAGVEKVAVIDMTEDYPSERRVKQEEESNDKDSENGSKDGAVAYEDLESESVQDTDVGPYHEESLQDTSATRRPPQRYIPQLNAGGK